MIEMSHKSNKISIFAGDLMKFSRGRSENEKLVSFSERGFYGFCKNSGSLSSSGRWHPSLTAAHENGR